MKGLELEAKSREIIGQEAPTELIRYRTALNNRTFDAGNWFKFWCSCQSWNEPGEIKLETIRELSSDFGLEYGKRLRKIIEAIEDEYRKARTEWEQK